MALVSFPTFSFSKLWTNSSDFPTVETSENQVRQDLQELHDQTKNYINNDLIPALTENFNACVKSDAFPVASASAVGGVKVGSGLKIASGVLSLDLDKVYPVGAIYLSVNSTDPGTIFGGTWARIQGQFLLGASSTYAAGSTGGEATHTLTKAEMPSHTHTGPSHRHTGPSHAHTMGSHTHTISLTTTGTGVHTHIVPAGRNGFVIRNDGSGAGHGLSDSSTKKYNFDAGTTTASGSSYSNTDKGGHTHTVSGKTGSPSTNATGDAGTGYTSYNGTGDTGSAGSGSAHNNMPPYLAVYIWKRTA